MFSILFVATFHQIAIVEDDDSQWGLMGMRMVMVLFVMTWKAKA